ncbi:MAG: dephospho-CoA kinase [Clostridiales Family XIII bacterium]|nr:dephospho-CoA kinase [Clostridiales Family XIII bacterium]
MKNDKPKIIAITGGIGSGKTAVTDYIQKAGYPVIDADVVAREVVMPDTARGQITLEQLKGLFGDDIILADGTMDRKLVASRAFVDDALLQQLNAIMHKAIQEEMNSKIAQYTERNCDIFLAIPLLYETQMATMADSVWVITADEATRVSRAAHRDGVSEDEVRARIAHQMPEDEKIALADIVIYNNGSACELIEEVRTQLIRELN